MALFVFFSLLIAVLAVFYTQGERYVAAVNFEKVSKAIENESGAEELEGKLSDVVKLDSRRAIYHRNLAMARIIKAQTAESNEQETEAVQSLEGGSYFEKAKKSLEKAVELNEKNAKNYLLLGDLNQKLNNDQENNLKKALKNYKRAEELDPFNFDLKVKIAENYLMMADKLDLQSTAGGLEEEEQTPSESEEYLNLAKQKLEGVLEKDSYNLEAGLLLVSVYQRSGEDDKAIQRAEKNLQLSPESPELHFDLGLIYYYQEDYQKAKEYFSEAVDKKEDYPDAQYLLGISYAKLEEKEKALETLKKLKEKEELENQELDSIIENVENDLDPLENLVNGEEEAPEQFTEEELESTEGQGLVF
jgi:cytochrome c-type biogenesis protein CcmH/NrfG